MVGNNRHWLGEFRRPENPVKIIGYCENIRCNAYLKGALMWMHEGPFVCDKCRGTQGFLVSEKGIRSGPPNAIYGEVRVEYNFDPTQKKFQETAVLRDDALGSRIRTFTFQSPIIRVEKTAFQVATGFLATLNDGIELALEDDTEIPRPIEHVLNFDLSREEFKRHLEKLEWALGDNAFFQTQAQFDVFSLFSGVEDENPLAAEESDIGSQ